MRRFRDILLEKYLFQNTGNSNYLTLDNKEILHYNLKTLNNGYIELIFDKNVHKIPFRNLKQFFKDVESLTSSRLNQNDEGTKIFLSFLPTCHKG